LFVSHKGVLVLSIDMKIRDSFRKQAIACLNLGSPFTARLCNLLAERLDDRGVVGGRVLNWRGNPSGTGDALALRLCGALNALVIENKSSELQQIYPPNHDGVSDDDLWLAIKSALEIHAEFIVQRLQSAPQTNEVRRSSILLPGFSEISRLNGLPLVLSELGASAGLNLYWDRFFFCIAGQEWGDDKSQVRMAPKWQGAPVQLHPIEVITRAGCDLNPLNVLDKDNQKRLLSYIWPDQSERITRTKAAIDIAVDASVQVEKSDAIDWLEKRLGQVHNNAVHVVYNTIAWQYFPKELHQRGVDLMQAAGKRATKQAPLAWLRFEADGQKPGAVLTLTLWPTGEEIYLARADFHGRWVVWQG
jgi:hypothetical protein